MTTRSILLGTALLAGLLFAEPAQALTITIDDVPDQVAPNQKFEIGWSIRGTDQKISVTTIYWGTRRLFQNKTGQFRSGPAGRFRNSLQAPPLPGTIYYSVFVNVKGRTAFSKVHRLRVASPPLKAYDVAKRGAGRAIPDGDTKGLRSSVRIDQDGKVGLLEVEVDVRHPFRGDVDVALVSPRGTRVELFKALALDWRDDIRWTFGRNKESKQPLTPFLGQAIRGTWTLVVRDRKRKDAGRLVSWTLRIKKQETYGLERRVDPVLKFPAESKLPPGSIKLERAFPQLTFQKPLLLTGAGDGSDRVFVVEQDGKIKVLPNSDAVTSAGTFLDVSGKLRTGGEEGLLGLAFAPDYTTSGAFYVFYSVGSGTRRNRLSRFKVSSGNPNKADPASEKVLLEVTKPSIPIRFGNHNGGMLAFGKDGMLYLSLGDGGSFGDPGNNAQDRTNLLGTIVRIDVSKGDPYTIPADNPFVSAGNGVRGEIWAYGLRNPWRFSFDRKTGVLWCADVGQGEREEVSLVTKGANLGWPLYEGTRAYDNPDNEPRSKFSDPIAEYDHTQGRSITGGYVYRGKKQPELVGKYFYADFVTSRIWALVHDGTKVVSNAEVGRLASVSSFGEDDQGELYAISHAGTIHRLTAVKEQTGGDFPQLLSQTGLFSDTARLAAAPGVLPFEVNAPLWSDGAKKKRWIALPAGKRITFEATKPWAFPQGTVLVKHFELGSKRLETRVLIHEANGWAGYTYKWKADHSDAVLLEKGLREKVGNQTWVYPSRADCMACHTAADGFVLGVRTRQLNREFPYAKRTDNQLRAWSNVRMFTRRLEKRDAQVAFPNPYDVKAPLAKRARTYLAVNCSMCHQPGGPTPSDIDLRFDLPLKEMKLVGVRAGNGDLGLGELTRRVRAGDKAHSVLWERMRRTGSERMPAIGSLQVDSRGVKLIGEWIDALQKQPDTTARHPAAARVGISGRLGERR